MLQSKEAETTLAQEFDRQVETLVHKGYPRIASVTDAEFVTAIEPLRQRLAQLGALDYQAEAGRIPFAIVVKSELLSADLTMSLVERNGQAGFSTMDADDVRSFQPTEDVHIPGGAAYLMVDVDTGQATFNVTPDAALKAIQGANRSPLTLDEGIALLTQYPAALPKNHGFSLPGSRCGDRRVTALWLSAGKPRLGWCWAGNPHTWLGSASCGSRVGP